MNRALVALGVFALALAVLLFLLTKDRQPSEQPVGRPAETAAALPAPPLETPHPAEVAQQGFLYGRVTTADDRTYEGRLRFGGDDEAFWDDAFNAAKDGNPWATLVPPDQLTARRSVEVFGVEIPLGEEQIDLDRPFMARFGDIARIEVHGTKIQVVLKNGTELDLDRMGADDLGDGLRLWDVRGVVVDLEERDIRIIELMPTARIDDAPNRLHGTVRTQQGEAFTGFIQWEWGKSVGTDELRGRTSDGERVLPFDAIASIVRNEDGGARVGLLDGDGLALSGTRDTGDGHRGISVEDPRFGRVRVTWDAFARVTFHPGDASPAYGDFPPGRPLTGSVTTHDGRRLAGRLVYDLDESLTTDMLDAPDQGVHFAIPFGLIAQIIPPVVGESTVVILHNGEARLLESTDDLGPGNAGMLVFAGEEAPPEHVRWSDVISVSFDRPTVMYPRIGKR
jgi:hypothetical protein